MRLLGFLVAVVAGWVMTVTPARADSVEIFPLEDVRPGLKGYGLSTPSGTKPVRWEFEVIGVMQNFRPKMSIILVKSDDPMFEVPGFWRGQSGSPLFVDGKLMCAFSYGWQFSKKAIGGCTPLPYMIEEGLKTPVRAKIEPVKGTKGKRATIVQPPASRSEWLAVAPGGDPHAAMDKLGAPRQPWLMRAPLPPAPQAMGSGSPDEMVPVAIPLAISGFTNEAFGAAKEMFADFPVSPMQGGGTGSSTEGPSAFELGAPIAVALVRGDMSFAGTGTVSYVEGERVLAFGHPFFEQGEFYAPVTAAEIHTVLPSAISGFVLASPLRELGSLVQDRLPAIMADTRLRNRMIPMTVTIEANGGKEQFHADIVHNRFLTGPLAGLVAMNAISRYLPDIDHATVLMESTVSIRGKKPLRFTDYLYSGDGAASVIGGARGLRVLVPLLHNPFEPLEVERIEISFKLAFDSNYGNIEELRLEAPELQPGARNYVNVVMTTYNGTRVTERVPFDVPESLAGSIVKLEVSPGDMAPVTTAPPNSVDGLLAAFADLLPGNVFAVTIYTAEHGVAVRGVVVNDLPPSAVDRFHLSSRTDRAEVYRPISRSVAPATRALNNRHSLLVKVSDID